MSIEDFILKWAPHLAPEEELYADWGENLLSTPESEAVLSRLCDEFTSDFFAFYNKGGVFQKWCAPEYRECKEEFMEDMWSAIREDIFLG